MSFSATLRRATYGPQGYVEILRMGLPLVASMGTTTVMQFTDRLFLSHYSVEAIAAALPAGIVSLTIMLTLMGVCSYSAVLIAQYVGSRAPHRVGSALWQGIWCSLLAGMLSALTWFLAEPLFALSGHDPEIQLLEVHYFRALAVGSVFGMLDASVGGFFSGMGKTQVVMWANFLAAVINIPLDYLLIFGGLGIPSLGIVGAGIATSIGWLVCFCVLAFYVFTAKNEKQFKVLSGWRLEWDMCKRLLRFGLPSGVNMFIEMIAFTWFLFEIGIFGKIALAASNIAFSINGLVFTPMLGLNMAVAMLVGQAMGRGKPLEAERYAYRTLQIAFAYMVPMSLLFVLAPVFLLSLFIPEEMSQTDVRLLLDYGVVLLFFIAVYSLVDASGIIFFGALKGAGDTMGLMILLIVGFCSFLLLPITLLKYFDMSSLYTYWVAMTSYIVFLAGSSYCRFRAKGWHTITVVETRLP